MSSLDHQMTESAKPSFMPIAIRHALIGMLILIAVDLLSRFTGIVDPLDQSKAYNSFFVLPINWAVIIGTFWTAIKRHRDEDLNGLITFGRGYSLSLVTGLIIAALTFVWIMVYVSVIEPDLMESVRNMVEEQIESQGGDKAMAGYFTSPLFVSLMSAIYRIFAALILGAIVAAIMQRKPVEG